MSESSTTTAGRDRQAQWRERIARQAASGLSVAAFCKREGIAAQSFYGWRTRLGKRDQPAPVAAGAAPFIDLGELGEAGAVVAGIDIRLDLGNGMVLTIARR